MTDFPFIDQRLIAELDKRFPHRCADPKDSEREIWMKAGERRLADWLTSVSLDQQENILNV